MKDIQVKLVFFLVAFTVIECMPSTRESEDTIFSSIPVGELNTKLEDQAKKYLSTFGYTDGYTDQSMDLGDVIKDFQYFAGLLVTGELDSPTLRWMKKKRCGLKDPPSQMKREGRAGRVRRYNRQGTWWRKKTLTWKYIHNPQANNAKERYPDSFSEDDVRKLMRKAMDLWEKRTNIEFVEKRDEYTDKKDEPDILISFVTRRHLGDPFPFDGQGGVLAHAFYPGSNMGFAGDVHFDDDEKFTIDNKLADAKDLMWVATHELGHSLGLDHSGNQDAVMYPYYMGYRENFDLKYDDILGIQTIYGGKVKPKKTDAPITTLKPLTTTPLVPKPPIPTTTPLPDHKICPASKITATWDYTRDGSYFMLTENGRLYTVSRNGKGIIDRNIRISEYYNVPHAIDAVYQTDFGDKTNALHDIVFTSKGYYVYKGFNKVSGPFNYKTDFDQNTFCSDKPSDNTPLKLHFPTYVKKVDAVMKWQRNGKVYFFTGDKYWRYDESKKRFDCGYPRLISPNWRGLGGKIDSAYSNRDQRITFFTKKDNIYQFDDKMVHVKAGYPRSVQQTLLQCKDVKKQRTRRDIQHDIRSSYKRHMIRYNADVAAPEP